MECWTNSHITEGVSFEKFLFTFVCVRFIRELDLLSLFRVKKNEVE